MRNAILGLIVAGLAGVAGLATSADPSGAQTSPAHGWSPPLDGPQVLTSTFGEYRRGHFHSGLDFSTGQRVGVAVRAVDGGEIVRLRASGYGYGRAIYLRTNTGLLAVYAHLMRFAPRIEVLLRDHQRTIGEYEADLTLAQPLPVHRGELLGWSGDTGAGPAHFHFELRRGDEPVNPLLHGFGPPDPEPPQIQRIRLQALTPESRINGGPETALEMSDRSSIPRIELWGDIGVVCEVLDRAAEGSGRLAPLEVSLHLRRPDGSRALMGRRLFEELSYSRTKEVERVYAPPPDGDLPEIRLFVWPGTTPDPSWTAEGLGVLQAQNLGEGVHEIVVEARDAAGHVGVASVPFTVRQPSRWVTLLNLDQDSGRLFGEWQGPAMAGPPPSLFARKPGGDPSRVHPTSPAADGRWWLLDWGHERTPVTAWTMLKLEEDVVPGGADSAHIAQVVWSPWDENPQGKIALEHSPAGFIVWLHLESPPASTPRLRILHDQGGRRQHFARAGDGRWWSILSPSDLAALSVSRTGSDSLPGSARWKDGATLEVAWGPPGSEGVSLNLAALCVIRPSTSGAWFIPGASWSFAWTEGTVYGDGILKAQVDSSARVNSSAWVDSSTRVDSSARANSSAWIDSSMVHEVQWRSPDPFPSVSLPRVGAGVVIEPSDFPLAEPMILTVHRPEASPVPDRSLGLYSRAEKGWRWVGSFSEGEGGALHAQVSRLGTFTILQDNSPPWILGPQPRDGMVLADPPTVLSVYVSDAGSGFRHEDADIWLDGEPTLARYDPDAAQLVWEIEDLPQPGPHTWEVRVADRAGLVTARSFSFLVEGP